MRMNLPSGELLRQAANAKQADYRRELMAQLAAGFSGYLVVTVEGLEGMEEGALFFRNGQFLAAVYEYPPQLITLASEEASRCCFNALAADYAAYDLVKLSNQQVDLVMALNEPYRLKNPVDRNGVARSFANSFSTSFAEKHLSQVRLQKRFAESRYNLLKRLGLHKLGD